jgi:LAS superfamily LD-carboxypeptidase LdcB
MARKNSKKNYRKKKPTMSVVAAVGIIGLCVALLAILLTSILSMQDSTQSPKPTTATTTQSVLTPTGSTTISDNTNNSPEVSTTPSVPQFTTTTQSPDLTNRPITTPAATTTVTTTAPQTTPARPEYVYHIDMNKFESAIDPTGDLWDDAYLLLVNVNNPIGKDAESNYEVLKGRTVLSKCTDYKFKHKPSIDLNNTALKALAAMFLEAEAQGITTLDATSAYRSYSYQSTLFNNNCNKTKHWLCECGHDWIHKNSKCELCGKTATRTLSVTREEQEASVATYSCAPGTSDHQTGLAVDIVQRSLPDRFDSLIQEFGETEAGKWLAENAHHFGFVLRFPEDKQNITGIIYEPWHFRYVGRTHATAMYEMNLCLEEYVEYLDSIGYFN